VDGRITIMLFGVRHVGVDRVTKGPLVGRGSPLLFLGAPVTLDQLDVERVLLLHTQMMFD
jgi:hypothetical protein